MRLRAPASSANIGAGFDCAAVALDLWNELDVTDGAPGTVEVVIEGVGEDELPRNEKNLTVRAYALLEDPAGKRFHCRNRIPLERGLGSSAAAIALGLAAARPSGNADDLRRGRAVTRRARRQPRLCPRRRRHADLGGARREDRGDAAARAGRDHPAHAAQDRPLAPRAASRGPTRRRRGVGRAGPPSSVQRPHRETASCSWPRSTTGCTSRTGPRPCSTRSGRTCLQVPGERRSRDRARA